MTVASCKATNVTKPDDIPKEPEKVQSQTPAPQSPDSSIPQEPLQAIAEGKIEGLNVGIGSSLQAVVEELGEPASLEYFEGTSFASYDKINFILDKMIQDTSAAAKVTGISVSEGYQLFGVTVGMKAEEIKSILGAADQEYKDNADEGDMWKLGYISGDYVLTFYFDDRNSPSTAAYITYK